MNILYSADNNYAKYASISIESLLDNNKDIENINIYFINNNISDENIKKIREGIKKYRAKLKIIDFNHICKDLRNLDGFSKSAYARLFVADSLDIDKIIYIDCDTIVENNLLELWNINIEEYFIAGVQDNVSKYMKNVTGLNEDFRYINSGVLLLNLKRMRSEKKINDIIEFIEKYKGEVPHHDQGVINGVFKEGIKIIHPKFNLMSQFFELNSNQTKELYNMQSYYTDSEIQYAKDNPIIIHYISKFYGRPWSRNCTHPLKDRYLYYLNRSEWNNKLDDDYIDLYTNIRKFIYKNCGFQIYKKFENILNIKRKKHFYRKYRFILEEKK